MKLKINFALKSGVTGEIPIIANINFGYKEFDLLKGMHVYKPLRYYTGIKVGKDQWDQKNKAPYEKARLVELENMRTQFENIFNYLNIQGAITPDILKAEFDLKLKGKDVEIVKKVSIVDFIENEILLSDALKKNSKPPYQGLANKLKAYEIKMGKTIYSNDFNEKLYTAFIDEMRSKLHKINAVWSVQKLLISTLHEIARKYKITVFDPKKEIPAKDKITPVSADSIYLNMDQIKCIIDFQPKDPKMQNTKLILLTLLFTGCRESDVHKISLEHLYEKNGEKFYYSRYISEKTDIEVIVPILKPLLDAIKKNDGPAYKVSQQKFNEQVKDLLQACKLNEIVTISYTDSMGKKQFTTKKLYQFVSSHIGRRSFVTNLINFIPVTTLTKITGHTLQDKSIIFGYNKISLLDNVILFRTQLRRAVDENPEQFPFALV